MDRTLKVGLVGANWALRGPGAAWRAMPGVQLAAICTAHEETARAAASAARLDRAYWDYRALVADPDIDIVSISTKPSVRFDITLAALGEGKHVFQAVPFAVDCIRAKALRDAQRDSGLVGVIDAHWRWLPTILRMKELIEIDYLGTFSHATFNIHTSLVRDGGFIYPQPAWSRGDHGHDWLGEVSSGAGAWRNFGSHAAILLEHLFGPIAEVIGHSDILVRKWRLPDGSTLLPQTEDVGTALVRFARGGTATISASWSTPKAAGLFLEAWGDNGRLVMKSGSFEGAAGRLFGGQASRCDHDFADFVEIDCTSPEISSPPLAHVPGSPVSRPIFTMLAHMVDAVRRGGQGAPSFDDALRAQRVVDAMALSVVTRTWERVPTDAHEG